MHPSPGQPGALLKYGERGFDVINQIALSDPGFPTGPRYIADKKCWTLPLDMEGLDATHVINASSQPLSQDPIAAASWSLWVHVPSVDAPEPYVELQCRKQRFDHLFHHYSCVSGNPYEFAHEMITEECGVDIYDVAGSPLSQRRL